MSSERCYEDCSNGTLSRCCVIAVVLERFKRQIRGYFCGNRPSPGVSMGRMSWRPLRIIGYYFVLNILPNWFLLNDFHTISCSCHWIYNVSLSTSCSSAFRLNVSILNVSIRVTSGALTTEHNSEWIRIYQQINYLPVWQLQVSCPLWCANTGIMAWDARLMPNSRRTGSLTDQ
jgi:hypothetical protein